MKDGKFEVSDLDAKELIVALISLLTEKNIITTEEFVSYRDAILDHKNMHLEKELEENPAMKFILDMMSK